MTTQKRTKKPTRAEAEARAQAKLRMASCLLEVEALTALARARLLMGDAKEFSEIMLAMRAKVGLLAQNTLPESIGELFAVVPKKETTS